MAKPIHRLLIAANWDEITVNLQVKALAKELSQELKILFLSQGRIPGGKISVNKNLEVRQWPNKRPTQLRDALFLIRQMLIHKTDSLIVHYDATILCLILGWMMGVKHRIAWVHTVTEKYVLDLPSERSGEVKRIFLRRRLAYKFASNVVVITKYSEQDVNLNYGISGKKITQIYNGVFPFESMEHFEKIHIRYVGRIDYSKGLDLLIAAFSIVSANNERMVLEIVGRGDQFETLRDYVIEQGLEDKIIFHGYWGDYQRTRQFIAEAYCMVIPSRADNFPTVVLEAMSSGVPVIAANIGGIPEMIEDKSEGFLVNTEDVNAIVKCLTEITENPFLRQTMSLKAKRRYKDLFTVERHLAIVTGFLRKL